MPSVRADEDGERCFLLALSLWKISTVVSRHGLRSCQ